MTQIIDIVALLNFTFLSYDLMLQVFFMSHSLLWRHIVFAGGLCLFKQPQSVIYHWNQYDEEVSKKCRSDRPSVCPFVTLTKNILLHY